MAFFRGPNIILDGLILLLDSKSERSYSGSGTVWVDMINSINGTLQSEAMATDVPGVMSFNGSTYKINFGHNIILEPVSITISAWVKLENIGDRHILFTKWFGWSFEIHADGRPYFRTNGTSPVDTYATQSLIWGNWYNIVGMFDATTNSGKVYINGKLSNSNTKTGSITYGQGTFNIPYSGGAAYTEGEIGRVEIYNRGLSATEVAKNFNAHKYRFGLG